MRMLRFVIFYQRSARVGATMREAVVLNTTSVAAAFVHTEAYPMYVTNPAVFDARRHASRLYLLRVTPLSYICSPVHTLTIVKKRYAENSHTVIASFGARGQRPIILANLSNSQDARGVLEEASDAPNVAIIGTSRAAASTSARPHRSRHLWVLHTVEQTAIDDGRSVQRIQALQFKLGPLQARLTSRVTLHAAINASGLPSWRLRDWEKNWAFLRFEYGEGALGLAAFGTPRTMILSYALSPHQVIRCGLHDGACTLAHSTAAPSLWASAFRTVDDLPSHRHPPRCGTPCLQLQGRYVCFGHFKTRLRRQYKCALMARNTSTLGLPARSIAPCVALSVRRWHALLTGRSPRPLRRSAHSVRLCTQVHLLSVRVRRAGVAAICCAQRLAPVPLAPPQRQ